MKKLILVCTVMLLCGVLTACGSYADIPSEDTLSGGNETTLVETEASLGYDVEAIAFYGLDIASPAFAGDTEESAGVNLIDETMALKAALDFAELAEENVYDVEAELEYEPTGAFWEIEFSSNGFEYSFYIDAESGDVVRSYVENDD